MFIVLYKLPTASHILFLNQPTLISDALLSLLKLS